MGQNSSIEWTHHTFNPWWGCLKVSPGCEHCYALTLSKRFGHDIWGPAKTTSRRTFGEKHWAEPLKWNAEARTNNHRKRVFCASMADVFEDHPQVYDARLRLFNLIDETPNLDWLLLTKRPENIMGMLDDWAVHFPQNIWIGTSCEDQQRADERIPHLLKVPARVRFLSCEPLLGPIKLDPWNGGHADIHWVIAGGESGPGARPMHPDWARSLRDQCSAAGVAFHFKQWGEYGPWPEDKPFNPKTPVFQWQRTEWNMDADHWENRYEPHYRVGKHAAGRLLDGRTWDQFPV